MYFQVPPNFTGVTTKILLKREYSAYYTYTLYIYHSYFINVDVSCMHENSKWTIVQLIITTASTDKSY